MAIESVHHADVPVADVGQTVWQTLHGVQLHEFDRVGAQCGWSQGHLWVVSTHGDHGVEKTGGRTHAAGRSAQLPFVAG
ncbi:MAG: hypothetical protein A2537_01260 [Candidatus Magasanikbacteria bacterium RIFOXYD2_FULL_36_9]|uniref:Uncharacterized protein n=1 Tax=Candidatus Magasanikbacteria bacterium RIFOXYD2_FULL_36_9 TaxID=1798707 RepID=A0A1F6NYM6_9BACT|nr:MAG: hypothetical protein A2537_01260 [Candidatus Magasanikbacteria bacterium RIFOXYD2_FULL_36_9]